MVYGLIQFFGALFGVDTNTANSFSQPSAGETFLNFLNWALPAIAVLIFLPVCFGAHFSVFVRRAHDFGSSTSMGVLMGFITFIPYLGLIPALYMLFKKGDSHTNEFGAVNTKSIWKNILNQDYKETHKSVNKTEEVVHNESAGSHCTQCGASVSVGAKFCKSCGAKI
jgi:uncharacterized membrane protein YhaH (DUF805 family)/ribosomal protein L40E